MSDYTPDTPMSVLTLFDADKKALEHFTEAIVNSVSEGREDPLKVLALSKKIEFTLKRINEGIKDNIERAAMLHPKGKFQMLGTEMEYTTTSTKYDYSVCNDPEWNEANQKKEQREKILKSLDRPINIVIESTGEIVKINPPLKLTTEGIKTTVK